MAVGSASLSFLLLLAFGRGDPDADGGLGLPDDDGATASAGSTENVDTSSHAGWGPLPRRFRWGFETADSRGRELYAMGDVPIFLGGRLTQPDWIQEFGLRVDPENRDRYPREPIALFSNVRPHSGRRALCVLSRGDHALVHLMRPILVAEGISFRLRAQVRTAGTREGAFELRIRFRGEQLSAEGQAVSSPMLRSQPAWQEVEVAGQVPANAESLDIELHLLGSYRDGDTQAWVDTMELELLPGLRLDWHGRRLLFFGTDEPASFDLEAYGLASGTYRLEAGIQRISVSPAAKPRTSPLFVARRYVAEPAAPVVMERRSGATERAGTGRMTGLPAIPLRFRGDVRQMFRETSLVSGLYDLTFRIRGPLKDANEAEAPLVAEHIERVGFLLAKSGEANTKGVRLGVVLAADPAGDLELVDSLPQGFAINALLWDLATVPPVEVPPGLPSPEMNERRRLSWRGRVGGELLRRPELAELFRNWAPVVRAWAIVGPRGPDIDENLAKLRPGLGTLLLGATRSGSRPSWASFQELEASVERGRVALPSRKPASDGAVEASDWALVNIPATESERSDFLVLSAAVLDLAGLGYQQMFLNRARELFAAEDAAGHRSPRLPALGWARLAALLESGQIEPRPDWDPRGRFLAGVDHGEQVLIAMSRGGETFRLKLWTGAPPRGEDLLGDEVPLSFDTKSLESELTVRPDPVIYRGLDIPLVDTVESLDCPRPHLEPSAGAQEVSFSLTNRTTAPIKIKLGLSIAGWNVDEETLGRTVAPGETAELKFRVTAREKPPSGRIQAVLHLEIEQGSRRFARRVERVLEISSRWIRMGGIELDPTGRKLSFTLESLAARPMLVRAYCRIPMAGGKDIVETWDEWLAAKSQSVLSVLLDAPPADLEGKEVWIGADAGGRESPFAERYHIEKTESGLRLVRR